MLILALDGALARCSAALWQDGAVRATARVEAGRGQAALLPPLVDEVLARANLAGAPLDAVAVGVGPGGFTGLRAAIALAAGLAEASGARLVGVSTGEALAAAIPAERRGGRALWTVIDNRRGGVFLEVFAPGAMVPSPPISCGHDALPLPTGPLAVAGDAAAQVAALLAARDRDVLLTDARLPEAAAIAAVAAQRLIGALPPRAAEPLYASPPAVRLP